jgi:hypothetical protein
MSMKEFQCQECGHLMSAAQAEKASEVGCPGCGGVDVDLAVPPLTPHRPVATVPTPDALAHALARLGWTLVARKGTVIAVRTPQGVRVKRLDQILEAAETAGKGEGHG